MKKTIRRTTALGALFLLLFFSATHAWASALTDMAGRDLKLDSSAQSVVVLMPGDCEILYAIGAGDLVVGRGAYCNYPEATSSVPLVQSGFEINIEQIISLMPELVVMTKMGHSQEQLATLEKAGITVAVTDAQDIPGVYAAISLLGTLVGYEEEASALVVSMREAFRSLQERAEEREGGSVYYEASPLEWGLWTAGAGTFMDEIGNMMKLENIFSDVSGWSEVSEEAVISRDPDLIVTTTMYSGSGLEPEEEVMGRKGWELIKAVADRRVFQADEDAITRPGPRLVEAAEALYAYFYGE